MGEKPIKREVNFYTDDIDCQAVLKILLEHLNLKLVIHEYESGVTSHYEVEPEVPPTPSDLVEVLPGLYVPPEPLPLIVTDGFKSSQKSD